jgi:integrase
MTWEQVDLNERRITLNPGTTKNYEARVIPLSGESYNAIAGQRDLREDHYPDCPSVFFRRGQRIKDFRGAWKAACKKVGLDGSIFHDTRRSAISNLVSQGTPERVAMQISGHKTRAVFDRYHICPVGELKKATDRAADALRESEEKIKIVNIQS